MALNRGGKIIPIEERIINRVSGKDKTDAAAETFFGAGEPVQPSAPEAKGRTIDFPYGYNMSFTPRAEQPNAGYISFATLRQVSDPAAGGLDIVALIIESIKDTIGGLNWNIKGRDGSDGGDKAKALSAKLQMPDGNTPFRSWLRPIIHDHLTIDQPAIYIRPTGTLPDLDVMDGATLKLLIDPFGRTPTPPYAAYQQNLHGVPAVDYSSDELIVPIYNRRSNKIYGFSRVEQAINMIGLGLRKQLSQIQYYTDGSIPDLLISTPENWNVDQISQYAEYWDSVLAGNTGNRRKARFIPADTKPFPLKEPPLKDALDEWIARVVSYCFSVSPDWAVSQMNRSTAEVQKETALQQGIAPIKLWLQDVMNTILIKAYDSPELEFVWVSDVSVDAKQQAEILAIYTNPQNPILTINEARKELGLDPMETTQDSIQSPLASPEPSVKLVKKKRAWEL